jgi:hypothetical protein
MLFLLLWIVVCGLLAVYSFSVAVGCGLWAVGRVGCFLAHYCTGEYYSLTPGHPNLVDATQLKLHKGKGGLSSIPFPPGDTDDVTQVSGAGRDWPIGRGCYVAADGRFSIAVGGKDHLVLSLHQKGRNLYETCVMSPTFYALASNVDCRRARCERLIRHALLPVPRRSLVWGGGATYLLHI